MAWVCFTVATASLVQQQDKGQTLCQPMECSGVLVKQQLMFSPCCPTTWLSRYSYSEDQLEYHYTKCKAALIRAVNKHLEEAGRQPAAAPAGDARSESASLPDNT